ncbi:unnamed protein product [Brassica oleracea]
MKKIRSSPRGSSPPSPPGPSNQTRSSLAPPSPSQATSPSSNEPWSSLRIRRTRRRRRWRSQLHPMYSKRRLGKYIKILGEALQLSQPINSNSISVHMPRFCTLLQLNKSAQLEDKRKTQAEICKITGLTLRKVYKELLENWDDLLPSNYTPAVPPEKAFSTTRSTTPRAVDPSPEPSFMDRDKPSVKPIESLDNAHQQQSKGKEDQY